MKRMTDEWQTNSNRQTNGQIDGRIDRNIERQTDVSGQGVKQMLIYDILSKKNIFVNLEFNHSPEFD